MDKFYVGIIITGKNPNLFIKRLIKKNILYNNMKVINYKQIFIKVTFLDYKKIVEQKSIYDIKIVKYYGLFKIINYIKNNVSFVLSFIISFIFLIFLSNMCFSIDIIHSNKDLRKLIYNELNDRNIKILRIIPRFNKRKKIVDDIIKSNKDKIEWLEIEKKGSKLIIKVTERKTNPVKEQLNPRHVIAKKEGIIKKIEASNGVILKKENDFVLKGDIIISGDIIKDETIKKQIAAQGVIYAEVWYTAHVVYPLEYKEIRYLEEVKNNYIINFLGNDITLKKNYERSYLENKFVLIKDNLFPFNIRVEKQRKIKFIKQKLKEKDAKEKALLIAEAKINARLSKDEYIISKKALNFTSDNSKIELDVFFKVYENITSYEDAVIVDLKEEENN